MPHGARLAAPRRPHQTSTPTPALVQPGWSEGGPQLQPETCRLPGEHAPTRGHPPSELERTSHTTTPERAINDETVPEVLERQDSSSARPRANLGPTSPKHAQVKPAKRRGSGGGAASSAPQTTRRSSGSRPGPARPTSLDPAITTPVPAVTGGQRAGRLRCCIR
jgi:hypothetical protein